MRLEPVAVTSPAAARRRLPLTVLVSAIDCRGTGAPADCPIGEGARGPRYEAWPRAAVEHSIARMKSPSTGLPQGIGAV